MKIHEENGVGIKLALIKREKQESGGKQIQALLNAFDFLR
jgi:hypothetical protein